MSGSQDGDAAHRQRSASPNKRSAALMEGSEEVPNVPLSDTTMPDVTPTTDAGAQTSEGHEAPPAYSSIADTSSASGPSLNLDDQVMRILSLIQQPLAEGQKGFVVSYKWLGRVMSRSNAVPGERQFDKDATEGDIGPVNNADIVSPTAFESPITPFGQTQLPFIPLAQKFTMGEEYEMLPEEAWNLVLSWYGLAEGQLPIARIAQDTAPQGSATKNIVFEVYPPVFTIRKVTPVGNRLNPPTPPTTSNTSQANTGTTTPDKSSESASIKIVASRTERFHSFLSRSKTAAAIPLKSKVNIWRQLTPSQVATEKSTAPQPGMLTPATSRSASPSAPAATNSATSLAIEPSIFVKWEIGTHYEQVDAADDSTGNDKYNGKITLDTLGLFEDQVIVLEEQKRGSAGGGYASENAKKNATAKSKDTSDSRRTSPAPSGPMTRGRINKTNRQRGAVGLTNLGNTCYMNSALQCISRVEELAVYFLEGHFKKEINMDNPLGHHGKMAKAYAELLRGLYESNGAFRPGQFKGVLASVQPMFSGYGQQDSQEFLSFLVDALHEDLNRVQKKPYIENPDSDDNTVHNPEAVRALGETYQKNHRARNDSIAMDLFNGFYKNTMVCPDCDKVSITFDPYSLLTLQLPIENTWHGHIYFVPLVGRPVAYEVDIDKNSTWRSVKQFIASKVEGLTRDRIMFTEIFSQKHYKTFPDTETIAESGLQPADVLCMFELSDVPTNVNYAPKKSGYRSYYRSSPEPSIPGMDSPLAECMAIPVMHTRGGNRGRNFVLNPTFITVKKEEAKDYDTILRKILAAVSTMTTRDFLREPSVEHPVTSTESEPGHSHDTTSHAEDEAATDADADGRVTDHSVPSEDGYVDVTLQDNNISKQDESSDDILHTGSFISDNLRSMFKMKYVVPNSGEMFCTGTSSLDDAKPMHERVQPRNLRRSSLESLQSSTSRKSSDSGFSGANRSSSVSDEDAAPDLMIGGQDASGFAGDVQSEDEPPQQIESKQARRRANTKKHGNKKSFNTYSKKGRRNSKQSVRSNNSRASTAQPSSESDEFYIKLGEGIVLDWDDQIYEALFEGKSRDDNVRGNFTFNPKTVPVAEDMDLRAKLNKRSQRARSGIDLEDCFAETGKTEILSEENAWYCSRCKELRRASKTLEIWTTPDILVVHLKRFSGERYRRDKVDILVDFPLEGLDLTKRVGCKEDGKEYVYDLFAVDNHYGGLGGGHYTAYAKNFVDEKWYDFNGKLNKYLFPLIPPQVY